MLLHLLPAALAALPPECLPPEDGGTAIYLLTMPPGAELYARFGHSGLWVVTPEAARRSVPGGTVYNFGVFRPSPTMVKDWLRGEQQYWLGRSSFIATLRRYEGWGRGVEAQRLDLPPEVADALAQQLSELALPENAAYRYHWLTNNCATRPRDLLDAALGGTLAAQHQGPSGVTARHEALRHLAVDVPVAALIDYLMGPAADRELSAWETWFMPLDMQTGVAASQGPSGPLVVATCTLAPQTHPMPPAAPPDRRPAALGLGVLLGGLTAAMGGRWRIRRALGGLLMAATGLVLGVPGLLSAGLWAGSPLWSSWRNPDLALANPLSLLLFPVGLAVVFGKGLTTARRLSGLLLGVAAVGVLLSWALTPDRGQGGLALAIVPVLTGIRIMAGRLCACATPISGAK
ncbi:MAG: DUF4105 domain-containing protein [Alphaproteobacteria bacterium]|nr:DUF4105 domain-containing protein [Alphaproteobacteria bacterium]